MSTNTIVASVAVGIFIAGALLGGLIEYTTLKQPGANNQIYNEEQKIKSERKSMRRRRTHRNQSRK